MDWIWDGGAVGLLDVYSWGSVVEGRKGGGGGDEKPSKSKLVYATLCSVRKWERELMAGLGGGFWGLCLVCLVGKDGVTGGLVCASGLEVSLLVDDVSVGRLSSSGVKAYLSSGCKATCSSHRECYLPWFLLSRGRKKAHNFTERETKSKPPHNPQ